MTRRGVRRLLLWGTLAAGVIVSLTGVPATWVPGAVPELDDPGLPAWLIAKPPFQAGVVARIAWTREQALYDALPGGGGRVAATTAPGQTSWRGPCREPDVRDHGRRWCLVAHVWEGRDAGGGGATARVPEPARDRDARAAVLWAVLPPEEAGAAPMLDPDGAAGLWATPAARPFRAAPASTGAEIGPEALDHAVARACPADLCPVIRADPGPEDTVLVTGRAGPWLRLEQAQRILWARLPARHARIGVIDAGHVLAGVPRYWRTCTRMVVGAGWWGRCRAHGDGRMQDTFERGYDALHPMRRVNADSGA